VSWPDLRREALALVEEASRRKLALRLLGSMAIRLSSPEAERILLQMRDKPKDLDLVCRRDDRRGLRQLFEEHGYQVDRDMLIAMEGQRYMFQHVETRLKLDLFVDRLEFCHTVNLAGRLDLHPLTIPVEDLVLSKLQIVKLTAGDLVDLATVFFCHAVADPSTGAEGIDASHIAAILARDWGFWRTAMANLARLRGMVEEGGIAAMGVDATQVVLARLGSLERAVEAEPKSLAWRLRAKVGERLQWWQDVDDREGTY